MVMWFIFFHIKKQISYLPASKPKARIRRAFLLSPLYMSIIINSLEARL